MFRVQSPTMSKKKTIKPPKTLLRQVGRAIADYEMIRDGDRILVGVSGGKDSLSLLHILHHLSTYAPVKFDVGAITVDPQIPGFDPSPLKPYLAEYGIPYHYVSQPIMAEAEKHATKPNFSFCAFCARMKRGIMYTTARNNDYNVIALGQHLDDLAESFLMSAMHRGQLRTMRAHYTNDAGDLRIIRPLVYVRERQTAAFAADAELPVIPENCPACFEMPTEREHMKQLLHAEEQRYKTLFKNLLSTMRPLLAGEYKENPSEQDGDCESDGM